MTFNLDNKIFGTVPEKNKNRALFSQSPSEILYLTFAYFHDFCVQQRLANLLVYF